MDEPNIDTAVRLGDVYGLMIEHYGQTGDYKQVNNKTYCRHVLSSHFNVLIERDVPVYTMSFQVGLAYNIVTGASLITTYCVNSYTNCCERGPSQLPLWVKPGTGQSHAKSIPCTMLNLQVQMGP